MVEKEPFERVDFELDESGSYPVSAQFSSVPKGLSYAHREDIKTALITFRGTLVENVLQPNVRLGNGLTLSTSTRLRRTQIPEPDTGPQKARDRHVPRLKGASRRDKLQPPKQSSVRIWNEERSRRNMLPVSQTVGPLTNERIHIEREALLNQREQQLLHFQQQLLMASMEALRTPPSPIRQRRSFPRSKRTFPPAQQKATEADRLEQADAELKADRKAAEIEAKERELLQREEILKWKHRSFVLQQELAQAAGSAELSALSDSTKDIAASSSFTGVNPVTASPEAANTNPPQEDGWQDPFAAFDPAPPDSLSKLRSRIRLPSKRSIKGRH